MTLLWESNFKGSETKCAFHRKCSLSRILFFHNCFYPKLFGGVRGAHLFSFIVVLCVFTFWIPCCVICYNFRIIAALGSSSLLVVCKWGAGGGRGCAEGSCLIYVICCLCLLAHSGVQHILRCVFCFVFFRLDWPVWPVSLDCTFMISPSVFSNVYSI